ncbi:MAG: PilZ domain-containing protein [Gammaproteobacteria bacterium]|nr:PilZ domain-containing protein [Gammaproteobacteria bacterium]
MSSIERRAYLRYNVSVPVTLVDQSGARFDVSTRDISLGGMRVECESALLTKLLPDGIQTSPGDLVILTSEFKNPKTDEVVSILSHVLAVLRLAESQFSIRFTFVDIDEVQQDKLQRLLNK